MFAIEPNILWRKKHYIGINNFSFGSFLEVKIVFKTSKSHLFYSLEKQFSEVYKYISFLLLPFLLIYFSFHVLEIRCQPCYIIWITK